jgi:NADH-quinone oxidoreductase subunit L
MFRLWFMTFFGERRANSDSGDSHADSQPRTAAPHGHVDDHGHGVHESPWVMLAPLVALAIGSIVSGLVGIPPFLKGHDEIDNFLKPAITTPADIAAAQQAAGLHEPEQAESTSLELALAGTSVAVAALGLFFAWLLYYKRRDLPDRITSKAHSLYLAVLRKYYVDEGYGAVFVKPLLALSTSVFWRGIDQGVIDGLVNGAGETSRDIGNRLRRMQSGNIRSYAAWVAAGGAVVIVYMLWHSLTGVNR